MASYPTAVKTFTSKADGAGNKVFASHLNDLQDEVHAIEDGLLNGTAPISASNASFARLSVAAGSTFVGLSVSAGSTLTTLNVTGGSTFGGVLNNAAQPRCVAYNSAVQSLANNNSTFVTFDSEDLDVGAMHSTSVSPSRITVPAGGDGLYWVRGRSYFPSNATGQRILTLRKNNTTDLNEAEVPPSAGGNCEFDVSGIYALVATDYVELFAYQNSGAPMNIGTATRKQANELAMVKVW